LSWAYGAVEHFQELTYVGLIHRKAYNILVNRIRDEDVLFTEQSGLEYSLAVTLQALLAQFEHTKKESCLGSTEQ